jgi:hypothetical protein
VDAEHDKGRGGDQREDALLNSGIDKTFKHGCV